MARPMSRLNDPASNSSHDIKTSADGVVAAFLITRLRLTRRVLATWRVFITSRVFLILTVRVVFVCVTCRVSVDFRSSPLAVPHLSPPLSTPPLPHLPNMELAAISEKSSRDLLLSNLFPFLVTSLKPFPPPALASRA